MMDTTNEMGETCKICGLTIAEDDNTEKVGQIGCNSINSASRQRGIDIDVKPGDIFHTKCRADHVNKKYIKLAQSSECKNQKRMLYLAGSPYLILWTWW